MNEDLDLQLSKKIDTNKTITLKFLSQSEFDEWLIVSKMFEESLESIDELLLKYNVSI